MSEAIELPALIGGGDGEFASRYNLGRLLKEGQGIQTFAATEGDGRQVVVKMARISQVAQNSLQRLEHEAGILRELSSPHVTPLLDVGRENGALYLVMPFIPGRTLETHLREAGPLPAREVLAIATCLLRALQEVHDHNIQHRDVKPANIVVEGSGRDARATLIDFGLARSSSLATAIRAQPAGTIRYMSPEQAGLIDYDVGSRADLYSLGVVLYECLAGHPPFTATSVHHLLRQHLTERPRELRSLGIKVPRALDETNSSFAQEGSAGPLSIRVWRPQ